MIRDRIYGFSLYRFDGEHLIHSYSSGYYLKKTIYNTFYLRRQQITREVPYSMIQKLIYTKSTKLSEKRINIMEQVLQDVLKLPEAMSARGPQRKPVYQYSKEGDLVGEYPSACEAGRKTGIDRGAIATAAKGRIKSAGGFIWKYAVDK